MNQTAWIIGGGIVIIAIAMALYVKSGPSTPIVTDTKDSSQISLKTEEASTTPLPIITPVTPHGSTTMTNETKPTPVTPAAPASTHNVILHTSMGDITVKLYSKEVPKAAANFEKLVASGFYDGIKFHRVIKGFMIQGGDPNSKDDSMPERWGRGGPGYQFDDEIDTSSAIYQRGYKHGVLAMANSGPNTNGSQFFIMAADYALPPLYVIFGEVTEGLNVVDAIDAVKTDGPAQLGGNDRPLTPVVIKSATVK